MERIEIKGANYFGHYDHVREACRAVILDKGQILLSYETKADLWMIPGGGLEPGESNEECVLREVAEETGKLIQASECVLQLDEFYEDTKYVSRYFFGTIVGTTETHRTEAEISGGLESRWLPIEEALEIFSKHNEIIDYEEKRGLYQRECMALKEILGKQNYGH